MEPVASLQRISDLAHAVRFRFGPYVQNTSLAHPIEIVEVLVTCYRIVQGGISVRTIILSTVCPYYIPYVSETNRCDYVRIR